MSVYLFMQGHIFSEALHSNQFQFKIFELISENLNIAKNSCVFAGS